MSRVLIVEPVASVREALGFVLELEGHEVVGVAGGVAGLAAIAARTPDVVLTEAELPDMPLPAFCAALHAALPAVRLIVSSLRPAQCTPVPACPGAAFLDKPFTTDDLLGVLTRPACR